MSSRDLLQNPIWKAEELGQPMPDSVHAVSVALPRWQDVVGYEEKSPEVMERLSCGYPRFVIHPLVQAVARQMIAHKIEGRIVNIASIAGERAIAQLSTYGMSKAGMIQMTRQMAREWGRHNINTNAICPGYIATENTRPIREDEKRNQTILDRIPEGRWGTPEDIAGSCVFLASKDADYLNGTVMNVDGGWLSR